MLGKHIGVFACHSEQILLMGFMLLKGEESFGHKFDVAWMQICFDN